MPFEMIVGLQVKNDKVYSQYRQAMAPLLSEKQGGFRYDFKVSEVLRNEEGRPINRVFAIYFASQQLCDEFFQIQSISPLKRNSFHLLSRLQRLFPVTIGHSQAIFLISLSKISRLISS